MFIGEFDLNENVFVIAEAGNNHEGSFQKAKELVHAAAESGADAVKFQTIIPEKLVSPKETTRIQQLKRFELSLDQFAELKSEADKFNIQFLTTPFALEVVDPLDQLVHAFKIASGDLTWHELIKKVASKNKPVLLSTGAATFDEIKSAQNAYHEIVDQEKAQLVLLQCVMAYPAPSESLNLNVISEYQKLVKFVGYSDHYLGINSCIAAVSLGAKIIEKHFTLDKNTSEFRDHQLSADPKEMSQLTKTIKEIYPMLGNSFKQVQNCELDIQKIARRSPKAKHHLNAGQTINQEDLIMTRPCSGLNAYIDCIGETIDKDHELGEDISLPIR